MRVLGLCVVLLVTTGLLAAEVVQLPRPDDAAKLSGKIVAERRAAIFAMTPSQPLPDWKNPYRGFALHIDAKDRLWISGTSSLSVPKAGDSSWQEVQRVFDEHQAMVDSSLVGVLVTSELPFQKSSHATAVFKLLYQPSVQIFYCKQAGDD